jgi:phosphatidylserine/phosphatidylglycerophosphate/cardiolipin synthase-like enzyme
MKRILLAATMALFGALAACAAPTEDTSDSTDEDLLSRSACDAVSRRSHPLELAVEPEASADPFLSAIAKASKEIRVMVYQMGDGPVLDALTAKAQGGLTVHAILDVSQKAFNQSSFDRLTQAGAKVLWSDPKFSFMHAKVMVIDATEAVISTGNYGAKRMAMERNYVMTDNDANDVKSLTALIDADFARATPDLSCTRLVVSPINSKERILDVISRAKKELLVESMQLADTDVRNAIVERKNAGVDVRVILADPSWIAANDDAGKFLAQNGIPAKRLVTPAVHVKSILVDKKIAYAGSENLSTTSLEKNREVGLVVTELANVAIMRETFETDYAAGTAF